MPQIYVKLLESNKQIEKLMLDAMAEELDELFSIALIQITDNVHQVVKDALDKSPEINSLRNGILRFDFGIPINTDVSQFIINSVASSVEVVYKPIKRSGRNLRGGVVINVQPSSFINLLRHGDAKVTTELGAKLPWLKWLLTEGDSILIVEYGVKYHAGGRSGGATMSKIERPFKVNSLYSGTTDDNFISRALETTEDEIVNAIESAL